MISHTNGDVNIIALYKKRALLSTPNVGKWEASGLILFHISKKYNELSNVTPDRYFLELNVEVRSSETPLLEANETTRNFQLMRNSITNITNSERFWSVVSNDF